jgi:hypothetical protein
MDVAAGSNRGVKKLGGTVRPTAAKGLAWGSPAYSHPVSNITYMLE